MDGKLKIWLWVSVAAAAAGALLLFPIGTVFLNVVFILVKACMIAGLLILLFSHKAAGYYLWAVASAGAIVMAILKWSMAGNASFLIIASIVVDILMPSVAYVLMKKAREIFR